MVSSEKLNSCRSLWRSLAWDDASDHFSNLFFCSVLECEFWGQCLVVLVVLVIEVVTVVAVAAVAAVVALAVEEGLDVG